METTFSMEIDKINSAYFLFTLVNFYPFFRQFRLRLLRRCLCLINASIVGNFC